jgi:aspartyl-tRNA synthetase
VETNEGFADFDTRTDFQQAQANGVELGGCKFRAAQQVASESMHQDIGCRMNEQPKLIGFLAVATGSIGLQRLVIGCDFYSLLQC